MLRAVALLGDIAALRFAVAVRGLRFLIGLIASLAVTVAMNLGAFALSGPLTLSRAIA